MRHPNTSVAIVLACALACAGSPSVPRSPPPSVPMLEDPDLEQVERLRARLVGAPRNRIGKILERMEAPERSLDETFRIGVYFRNIEDFDATLQSGVLQGETAKGLWFRGGEIQTTGIWSRDETRIPAATEEVLGIVEDCLRGRCPRDGITLSPDTRRIIEETFRGNGRVYERDPAGHLRYSVHFHNSAPRSQDLVHSDVGPGWWVLAEGNTRELHYVSLILDVPIVPPLVFGRN